MSKKNDNRMALIIVGSIIGGIVVGGVAGARLGFNFGVDVEKENQLEASLEEKKAFGSQLMLEFNQRVENASTELVGICMEDISCDQNNLDAMLNALNNVKVDESLISELLD